MMTSHDLRNRSLSIIFVLKKVVICFRVQILGIIFSREGDAALAVSVKVVNHRHLK
jgi:hypothetical protein